MTDRVCACGCGTVLRSARPQARYASAACRSKAWKERRGYRDPRKVAERAGKPSRSVSPRRREGVTVYFPSLSSAESLLEALEDVYRNDPCTAALRKAINRRRARA